LSSRHECEVSERESMSIEVLLMSDVPDLGTAGQIVSVKEGYARNYLLPRKLGAPVTEIAKKKLAKLQKDREEAVKKEIEEAKARAARMDNVSCTIPVKVTPDEKMYGSITVVEIAAALKAQGIDVNKSMILLPEPIRKLDVYPVKIRLHSEVEATVKIWVVKE
jgi:large subunit ribosomal protein L9